MDIRPDLPQMEQLQRRRAQQQRQVDAQAQESAGDQAKVKLDTDTAQQYVDKLRSYDPSNLHRVDELKAQIADGSYTADPAELADRLLDALDKGFLD